MTPVNYTPYLTNTLFCPASSRLCYCFDLFNARRNYYRQVYNDYVQIIKSKKLILYRKSLKFDGPISVLKVIDNKMDEDGTKRITLLVSSTIGPVTIWELRLQVNLDLVYS